MPVDRTIKRRLHVITFYLIIVIIYLLVGGALMMNFEAGNEKDNNKILDELVSTIGLTSAQINELESLGICTFPSVHNIKWTYTGSVFYTLTVITTIGYGSYAPRTLAGRIFTVFYALFGISVIGLLLSNLASVIASLMQSIMRRISPPRLEVSRHVSDALRTSENISIAELRSVIIAVTEMDERDWDERADGRVFNDIVNTYKDSKGTFDRETIAKSVARWYEIKHIIPDTVTARSLFFFFLACCIWVWVWAAIFSNLEGWGYFDSLWFAVITLSTIGFGDFAPETRGGRIAAFVFISPGIGMVAAFIKAITTLFERSRFWWMQKAYERGWVSEKIMIAQGISYALDGRDPGDFRSDPGDETKRNQELVELMVKPEESTGGDGEEVVTPAAEVPETGGEEEVEEEGQAVALSRVPSNRTRPDTKMRLPRNRDIPKWSEPGEKPVSPVTPGPPPEPSPHPYTQYTDGEPYVVTTKIPSTLLPHINGSFSQPPDTPPQPPKLKPPRGVPTSTRPRPRRSEHPTEELMDKLTARPSTRSKGK